MCGRKCKNCMTVIFDFLTKMIINFDFFFSIPIDIRYKNKRRFTNKTTIIFSLLAFVFITIPSLTQLYSLFFHTSPIAITSNIMEMPQYLNITVSNDKQIPLVTKNLKNSNKGLYMFGIGLFNYSSGKYVDGNASHLIILSNFTNIINKTKTKGKLNYVNCKSKFNDYDVDKDIIDHFNDQILCINNTYNLNGQFIDPIYNYISLKVIRCTNHVKNKYVEFKNLNCSTDEEWKNYINSLSLVYLDLNYYFSPNNFTDPIQPYLKKYEARFTDSLILKMDIFMSNSILSSYDNILPSFGNSLFSPNIYRYLSITKVNRFNALYIPSDSELISIVLRSSNNYVSMERYYNTLFQILAMLVGLWQAIYAILGFIINRYLDFSENVEMCNKIFKMVDPNKIDNMNENKYIPKESRKFPRNTAKFINSIKNSNVEELVLYEGLKYYENAGIDFNLMETFLHMFYYHPYKTKVKFAILDHATEHYNNFKDAKNLFNFAINLKEFLKFNFTKDQTYIISNFLNKTKFHHKNIENFKIIRNIVSSSSVNDEKDKIFEKREILKNTLNKFRKRKRGELNPIDEKLLKQLRIEENLLEYFVYNEIKGADSYELSVPIEKLEIKEKEDIMIPISATYKK